MLFIGASILLTRIICSYYNLNMRKGCGKVAKSIVHFGQCSCSFTYNMMRNLDPKSAVPNVLVTVT